MQSISIHRLPALPDAHVLPHSPISTARYIAQNSVERQGSHLAGLGVGNLDDGVARRVEVGDHQRWTWEASRLVDEKVGALVITIVGDEKPRRDGGRGSGICGMEGFKELGGLCEMT